MLSCLGRNMSSKGNKIILLFCRFLIFRFIMEQLDYVIKSSQRTEFPYARGNLISSSECSFYSTIVTAFLLDCLCSSPSWAGDGIHFHGVWDRKEIAVHFRSCFQKRNCLCFLQAFMYFYSKDSVSESSVWFNRVPNPNTASREVCYYPKTWKVFP